MRTLFITGTNTGCGKTVLTALLARFLVGQGKRVSAFKPICSGGRDDAQALHAALGGALPLDIINPWHFRAAIAPSLAAKREHKSISLAQTMAHIHAQQGNVDVTLVEGAGGLLSPLGKNFDSRDLILGLRAWPIIVAPNRLGVVNHLRLTVEALPAKYQTKTSIVLMSPSKADTATKSNPELLKEFFPPARTYILPWLGERFASQTAMSPTKVRHVLGAITRS